MRDPLTRSRERSAPPRCAGRKPLDSSDGPPKDSGSARAGTAKSPREVQSRDGDIERWHRHRVQRIQGGPWRGAKPRRATGRRRRQRQRSTTDSSGEQSLEVEAPPTSVDARQNDEEARAAETRYGSRRGESSEGCEPRSRGGSGSSDAPRGARMTPTRNGPNPMIGCRVQQTCEVRAEETVEAGRNGKGGTSERLATSSRRTGNRPGVDARA